MENTTMESRSTSSFRSTQSSQLIEVKNLSKGICGSVDLVKMAKPIHMLVAVKSSRSPSSYLQKEYLILRQFFGCPNIVQCYVKYTSLGRDNLVLDYASGGDLMNLIKKYGGRIPEYDVRSYTKMIVQGLRVVHNRGYVHCDLKPENILVYPLDESGGRFNLKLADFGLAKEPGDNRTWLTGGCFRGTPIYMSPESVKHGEITAALDIWSLGCVVVEMMTGKGPWESTVDVRDFKNLAMRIGYSTEIPEIPRDMSSAGRDFLKKCFARDPGERWTADRLLRRHFQLVDDIGHRTYVGSSV